MKSYRLVFALALGSLGLAGNGVAQAATEAVVSPQTEASRKLEDLNNVLKTQPNHIPALLSRGNLYFWDLIDEKKALADAQKLATLPLSSAADWNELGNLFSALSQTQRAIDCYSRAIKLAPNDLQPLENRASTLEQWARDSDDGRALFERALADYSKWIELAPTQMLPYLRRGYVHADLNQHEKAVADFSEAIKMGKNLAILHRANSLFALKRFDEAILDFQKSPGSESEAGLAAIYEAKGDKAKALLHWNGALMSDGENISYLKKRAALLRQMGKIEDAQKDENRVKELMNQ